MARRAVAAAVLVLLCLEGSLAASHTLRGAGKPRGGTPASGAPSPLDTLDKPRLSSLGDTPSAPGSVTIQACSPPESVLSRQQWVVNSNGQFRTGSRPTLCLTATLSQGQLLPGSRLVSTPCRPQAGTLQSWARQNEFIVPTSNPNLCLKAAAPATGGFASGARTVSLANCATECSGPDAAACSWLLGEKDTVVSGEAPTAAPLPTMCLTSTIQLPRTCDAPSPSNQLPFCDSTLPVAARARDLASRLDVTAKIDLIAHGASPTAYNAQLNVKSFMWDMTCSHGVDAQSGFYNDAPAVTVLPVPLALASSFDPTLLSEVATATSNEARVVSALRYFSSGGNDNWCLACSGGPTANIARDPRWGRLSETYGEDPFLVAALASAYTTGLQHSNRTNPFLATAAVARHALAFSGPANMLDFDVVVNNRTMEDTYVPAVRSVLAKGAPAGVSPSYNSVNGVPNTASQSLLTTTLRQDWGSSALVVSELGAVTDITTQHHYVPSAEDALVAAVNAGVQNILATGDGQTANFQSAISDGALSTDQLDAMVTRVLETRVRLGEFDPASANSYAELPASLLNGAENRATARNAAAKSVVLLKNKGNLLPLKASPTFKSIAVIGPNAKDHSSGFGQNLYLHSFNGYQPDVVDVVQGITTYAQNMHVGVDYVQGCSVDFAASPPCFCCKPTAPNFSDAVAAAKQASVAVVVVGTYAGIESDGVDRTSLLLPGEQAALIRAVASTGTKVVVVMVNGSPLQLADPDGDVTSMVDAVVEAWFGGEEAGNGLADVLFGSVAPSGRLPVTFYNGVDQLPAFEDYSMTAFPGRTYRYLESSVAPAYRFGFGLTYTKFSYTDLHVIPATPGPCDKLFVTVNVTNIGATTASSVSQVYVSVPTQQGLPTPRLSLQAVDTSVLSAGDSAIVSWTLLPYQWTTVVSNGSRAIAVGNYSIYVGGHQPGDTLGAAESNVAESSFMVLGPQARLADLRMPGFNGYPYPPPECEDDARSAAARVPLPVARVLLRAV